MVFYSDGLAKQGHFGQLNCIRVQSVLDKNTVNSCSCGIKLFTVSALGRIISTQMMFRAKRGAGLGTAVKLAVKSYKTELQSYGLEKHWLCFRVFLVFESDCIQKNVRICPLYVICKHFNRSSNYN